MSNEQWNNSTKLIEFIKQVEGYKLGVYEDSGGLLTVGVGHLILPEDNLKMNHRITMERCNEFLANDLKIAIKEINDAVVVPLTENQFIALVSFVFNVGRRAFRKSSVIRYINTNQFNLALYHLKEFKYVKGKINHGLLNRRKLESDLFLGKTN